MNLFKRTTRLLLLTVLQALILQAFAGDKTVTYYHTDHLGSPVLATDYLGRTVWKEDYGPWGEPLLSPAGNKGDIGYTGHYTEQELGLTYAQARWYDQVAGVFLSVDPVQFSSGGAEYFSRYTYVSNNPLGNVDPDGREISSVRNAGRARVSYQFNFSGSIVDKTGTMTATQLSALAGRMKSQIESSFSGSGKSGRQSVTWKTSANIGVGQPKGNEHEIQIVPNGSLPGGAIGMVNRIGGSVIMIDSSIVNIAPSSTSNVSFERTSAHEFGHSAGLLHPSGGLMSQTWKSNSLSTDVSQAKTIDREYKAGRLNK